MTHNVKELADEKWLVVGEMGFGLRSALLSCLGPRLAKIVRSLAPFRISEIIVKKNPSRESGFPAWLKLLQVQLRHSS